MKTQSTSLVLLVSLCGVAASGSAEDSALTWVDYHPELAKVFAQPCTPWECEVIETDLSGASQPGLVMGIKGELVANSRNRIFSSSDGGRSWSVLCEVPLDPSVPEGFRLLSCHILGCAVAVDGSLVVSISKQYNDGRRYEGFHDETYHLGTTILRSADRGKTWDEPVKLDPAPFGCVGANPGSCFTRLPGGVLAQALMVHDQPRASRPLPKSKWFSQAFLFTSSDGGRTWSTTGSLGLHSDESDVIALPSGRMLAVTRYQRKKLPGDPADLASSYYFDPEHNRDACSECALGAKAVGGHSVYKQTALLDSNDGGRTWSHPRLLTGWLQQTACLVRLADGTILMPFSHKDKGQGQRFMISYDEGKTWSRTVYELHVGGMYASSVVLDDGTIVTAYAERNGPFTVLRWRVPSRKAVEKGGFFEPLAVN